MAENALIAHILPSPVGSIMSKQTKNETATGRQKDGWDRYIEIGRWLMRRYTKDGVVIVQHGEFMSRYAALQLAFFKRYCK